MKKIELTIAERLTLHDILPKAGNYNTLIICSDIKKKIEISQNEMKLINLSFTNDAINWDPKKAKSLNVQFTEMESNEIKICLKKLNDENKLLEACINLYKKFVL